MPAARAFQTRVSSRLNVCNGCQDTQPNPTPTASTASTTCWWATYTVTATAKGFSTDTLKNMEVVLNTVITANLTLPVGSTATTVEVSAGAAQIDTTTAQLQTTFDTKQVQELPAAANGLGRLQSEPAGRRCLHVGRNWPGHWSRHLGPAPRQQLVQPGWHQQ